MAREFLEVGAERSQHAPEGMDIVMRPGQITGVVKGDALGGGSGGFEPSFVHELSQ